MSRLTGMVVAILLGSTPSLWAQTEWTEHRLPVDATTDEQLVLEIINRARANPTAEGTRLQTFSPYPMPGGNITEGLVNPGNVGPRPPLAMNGILVQISRAHSADMYTKDYFSHDSSPSGTSASTRAINAGYAWNAGGRFGENIATSSSGTAAFLEDFLMVDWVNGVGYPNRGHRVNLLDVDSAATPFREIGVGYHLGASQRPSGFKDFLTEDFGRRNAVGPLILGVVYDDLNTNNFYDLNEGRSGVLVRLSPAGSWFAVTGAAGGFAFPYTGTGNITVQATGGIFGAGIVSKTVNRTGENVKVDFKESDMTDADGDGLDDAWETTHFGNLAQLGTGDPDGDTFNNLAEFQAATDPMSAASTPPVTPPKKGGDGGGGCGLTGLGLLLPLLFSRLRRR
jgi:hypothetical protein